METMHEETFQLQQCQDRARTFNAHGHLILFPLNRDNVNTEKSKHHSIVSAFPAEFEPNTGTVHPDNTPPNITQSVLS